MAVLIPIGLARRNGLIFLGVNAISIPRLEEPMLVERFGSEYRQYCRHGPRLLRRLRPWGAEEIKR